jgi:hypothetical protein
MIGEAEQAVVKRMRTLCDAIEAGDINCLHISSQVINVSVGHPEDCPQVTVALDTRCRLWVLQFQMREGANPALDE